jgi:elongation factor G
MRVRNVSIVGHSGVGKTSLTEALLFRAHARERLGRVEEGTTASDHTEAEKRRGISISTSVLRAEWKDTTLNLLDAPGSADFVREIRGAIRAADASLVVVSAVSGVEVGTERVWATADSFNMPRIVVISRWTANAPTSSRCSPTFRPACAARAPPCPCPSGARAAFGGSWIC